MYVDTAILVKLLIREPDSRFYGQGLHGQEEVWSSELAITECWSALCRKMREREITRRIRTGAWTRLDRYGTTGSLHLLPVNREILLEANKLLDRCTPQLPLRTLDAIHLSSCMSLKAFPLWTNDKRMREAADYLGLPLGPLPQPGNTRKE